jgi:hypothetical protein
LEKQCFSKVILSFSFVETNLFIETLKNKYTKIKICKELMNILNISKLEDLTKDITKNFNNIIKNEWLDENIDIIKKTFDIRTKKYNNFNYYNIYLMIITILKNLFDTNLFIRKECQINKIKYIYHIFNDIVLCNHLSVIKQLNRYNFID